MESTIKLDRSKRLYRGIALFGIILSSASIFLQSRTAGAEESLQETVRRFSAGQAKNLESIETWTGKAEVEYSDRGEGALIGHREIEGFGSAIVNFWLDAQTDKLRYNWRYMRQTSHSMLDGSPSSPDKVEPILLPVLSGFLLRKENKGFTFYPDRPKN